MPFGEAASGVSSRQLASSLARGCDGGQAFVFRHQCILAFFPLWVQLNAFNRADDLALRLVMMPDTLGAFVRVDDIKLIPHRDGLVGALWFANITVDALVSDAKRHVPFSRKDRQLPPMSIEGSVFTWFCSEASAQPRETQIYSRLRQVARFPAQSFRI